MRALAPALAAVLALAGCGDDGGACGAVRGCGGSLVGSWRIAQSCVAVAAPVVGCETATVDARGLGLDGTLTFRADRSYEVAIAMRGRLTIRLPASCASSAMGCAAFEPALREELARPPFDPQVEVTCAEDGEACLCRLVAPRTLSMIVDQGRYETAASQIVLERPDGFRVAEFCVAGTGATLSLPVPSSGSGATAPGARVNGRLRLAPSVALF